MTWCLFWRVSAIVAASHLVWLMIARLLGAEGDIMTVTLDAFGLVMACRHIWHEMT